MPDFRHAKARQPEIIRAVQKDYSYTKELAEDFSEILRLTGTQNWIRYNNVCSFIAEIVYHGFATLNNLQTLGEEYTGMIQVDSNFERIPSKIIRLIAIILEFGGEALLFKVLKKAKLEITRNDELLPDVKIKLLTLIDIIGRTVPYIKMLHKMFFYFGANNYQISKRLSGVNYILIRHWLKPDHSLYGYKILGGLTFLQLTISLISSVYEIFKRRQNQSKNETQNFNLQTIESNKTSACLLCLEPRRNTSLTPCGHLFCWMCILNWLDEKNECPICRETVKKSTVIQLQNYS